MDSKVGERSIILSLILILQIVILYIFIKRDKQTKVLIAMLFHRLDEQDREKEHNYRENVKKYIY